MLKFVRQEERGEFTDSEYVLRITEEDTRILFGVPGDLYISKEFEGQMASASEKRAINEYRDSGIIKMIRELISYPIDLTKAIIKSILTEDRSLTKEKFIENLLNDMYYQGDQLNLFELKQHAEMGDQVEQRLDMEVKKALQEEPEIEPEPVKDFEDLFGLNKGPVKTSSTNLFNQQPKEGYTVEETRSYEEEPKQEPFKPHNDYVEPLAFEEEGEGEEEEEAAPRPSIIPSKKDLPRPKEELSMNVENTQQVMMVSKEDVNFIIESINKLHILDSLHLLEKLDNLEILESLNQLTSLKELDKLDKLESLDKLNKLESLDKLDKLEELDSLTKLDNLSKLDDLDHIIKESNSKLSEESIRDTIYESLEGWLDKVSNSETPITQAIFKPSNEKMNMAEMHRMFTYRKDETFKNYINKITQKDYPINFDLYTEIDGLSILKGVEAMTMDILNGKELRRFVQFMMMHFPYVVVEYTNFMGGYKDDNQK